MKIGGKEYDGELSHKGDVHLSIEDDTVVIRLPCHSKYEAAVLHETLVEQWLSGGAVLLGKVTKN